MSNNTGIADDGTQSFTTGGCHGCDKKESDNDAFASCLCFDAKMKSKGQRLCSACLETAMNAGTAKKCHGCGGFSCSVWCIGISECSECCAVVFCENCIKDKTKNNGFLSCRCGQFCFCNTCQIKLMSKEHRERLIATDPNKDSTCTTSSMISVKNFMTNDVVVGTTCPCDSCKNAAEKQKGKAPRWHIDVPGLMKIIPCHNCKGLIHVSPTCDECENCAECDTLHCVECGEPDDDYATENITCLECKKQAGPDFNWVRSWKGKEQRVVEFEDWKCSICRQYDDDDDGDY